MIHFKKGGDVINNEVKLIILRGNSGSGKSSVAKALQRKFGRGTLVISQDVIRRDMLWVKDEAGTKAISLLMDLAKYGKEHCDIVILEGILYSHKYMDLFQMIKQEFKNINAYYYDLPFAATLIRHQTKPNCNDFGEEQMKNWWREKDYIGIIPETNIPETMSLEKTVEMIFADIMSLK
jgi:ABC-type dipeptide/oligopeptide/nickel transport system ATPase component